jgi:hypothetical protein
VICTVRVLIHDHLYPELHAQELFAKFSREFVDGLDGTRKLMLPGTYMTDSFLTLKSAFLSATAAAVRVDPNAAVTVSDGNQTLSHGCREVEPHPLANLLAQFPAPPSTSHPLRGLHNFLKSQETNGSSFTAMPVPPAPEMAIAQIIGKLK